MTLVNINDNIATITTTAISSLIITLKYYTWGKVFYSSRFINYTNFLKLSNLKPLDSN